MGDTSYADLYRNINFREHPERYVIGKGEQGVLLAEPYKSEILPYWRFKTPDEAQASSAKIEALFERYKAEGDFVGMDMARKFMQMGWTRSRRYANHPSGRKYAPDGTVRPQDADAMSSEKAKSAAIFRKKYEELMADKTYQQMMAAHKMRQNR